MSTNKTPNYQLHSWEGGDHFLRAEMNENFSAIDTALASEAARAQEAETSLSATKANATDLTALQTTVGTKADSSTVTSHTGNATVHITAAERTAWSAKQAALTFDASPTSGSGNPVKSGGVYTALAAKADSSALTSHTGNTTVHITAAERTAWNGKQAALTFDTAPKSGSTNPVTSGGVYTAIGSLTTTVNGKSTVVCGSYTGNSQATQNISLGFRPKAVLVVSRDGTWHTSAAYGGLVVDGVSHYNPGITITASGFQVKFSSDYSAMTNTSMASYTPHMYLAIK